MPRFKIVLQYEGTDFFGWQLQASVRTVQGELEKALARFTKVERIKVIGAGRTDTGVHAWGQVAHFDLKTRLDTCELTDALNALLPEDIRAMNLEVVPDDFHARFSAKTRRYRYQCYSGEELWYRNQVWMTGKMDMSILQSVADLIVGEHDFLSFCKYRPDQNHTRCQIHESTWIENNNMLIYCITGNRFLHHMVRYLTGTMVAVTRKRFTMDEFMDLLRRPRKAVQIHKAPAHGLILEKIEYD